MRPSTPAMDSTRSVSAESRMDDTRRSVMVHPEIVTSASQLSGAAFLYFEGPILIPYPPSPDDADFRVIEEISRRWPATKGAYSEHRFVRLVLHWLGNVRKFIDVALLLEPLNATGQLHIRIPSLRFDNMDARAEAIAGALKMSLDDLDASKSAMAGAALLQYLVDTLYRECGNNVDALIREALPIFADPARLRRLAVACYLTRFMILRDVDKVLLMEPESRRLTLMGRSNSYADRMEAIGWEVFRQLLTVYLDPMDSRRIDLLLGILNSHRGEADRLRARCLRVAESIGPVESPIEVATRVQHLIAATLKKEIGDVLSLDKRSVEQLLIDTFSDERAWLAIGGFILGITGALPTLASASSALAAAGLVGAKVVRAAGDRWKNLTTNDFALLRTLSRDLKRLECRQKRSSP